MKKLYLLPLLLCLTSCNALSEYLALGRGRAAYVEAEQNRKISILEAEAKLDSAKYLAQAQLEKAQAEADAEIIRAHGMAEANRIIGDSLKGNECYLRYLWIQGLQTNQMQVVYVPTEANLPIMESQRFNQLKVPTCNQ